MLLPHQQPHIAAYSHLLNSSFTDWTGRPLIAADDIAHALYYAPFALVSHGTESDPIFRYANLTAQKLWGIDWDAFTHMPSRLSAEPMVASERQRLLDEASRNGYVSNYNGVRITKDGKRFTIKDTILWNVTDSGGIKHGQAACINKWEWV